MSASTHPKEAIIKNLIISIFNSLGHRITPEIPLAEWTRRFLGERGTDVAPSACRASSGKEEGTWSSQGDCLPRALTDLECRDAFWPRRMDRAQCGQERVCRTAWRLATHSCPSRHRQRSGPKGPYPSTTLVRQLQERSSATRRTFSARVGMGIRRRIPALCKDHVGSGWRKVGKGPGVVPKVPRCPGENGGGTWRPPMKQDPEKRLSGSSSTCRVSPSCSWRTCAR